MGRYIASNCRLCRREGTKLFLKGSRCLTEKCAFARRPSIPGMHAHVSSKSSYYGLQLREKQKVKRMYGVMERQFRRFYEVATQAKGVTGRTLLQMLESRLDNVVFRCLWAASRKASRQLVLHGFVFVNGKRASIPSLLVKINDKIEIRGNDKVKTKIKEIQEACAKERSVVTWIDAQKDNLTATVVRLPEKEDMGSSVNEQLIVELYSK